MRRSVQFAACLALILVILLLTLGLVGRVTAQIDNPNTYTPSAVPSVTPTALSGGYTSFQQILYDVVNGGGQTVLFAGPIDFHLSGSLEMLILADGQHDVAVNLTSGIEDYGPGVRIVVRGVVSQLVGVTVRASSGQVPEVINAVAWEEGNSSPTPMASFTPIATGTLSRTDIAGTRFANSTATRQAYHDNLTATASAVEATRTAYYDNATSTADAIYATRTELANEYAETATTYAENYVPPVATSNYVRVTSAPAPTYPPAGNGAPSGATALCNDGTYSYSQHRSGTCSHHGGVAQWLVNLPA